MFTEGREIHWFIGSEKLGIRTPKMKAVRRMDPRTGGGKDGAKKACHQVGLREIKPPRELIRSLADRTDR